MKPPLLSQAVLLAVAGATEADCVAGDLAEEFSLIRKTSGPAAARRWYRWQVARSICALLAIRVRSGEFTQLTLLASLTVAAPLLLLDRLWQFIYSQIPLKDGLHRAPEFLAVNALCACAGAAIAGARSHSKSRAIGFAFAAAIAVFLALPISAASAPTIYVTVLALAVPASALATSAWRRLR